MDDPSASYISRKTFFQSVTILFILMLLTGGMTRILPAGRFERVSTDGREMVVPSSFEYIDDPTYPVWRWMTAPVEVLWGEDGLLVITIILFILLVGGAFAVLERAGIMAAGLSRLVAASEGRKYTLLLLVSLFFMILGGFFGIFEEVVPLVPLALALSHYLGWDPLVGLGMSILATNLGFSAAVTNPFTIGVAQELAGLPLFSGSWLRIPIFLAIYVVLAIFLVHYARRVEQTPQSSMANEQGNVERQGPRFEIVQTSSDTAQFRESLIFFSVCVSAIVLVLVGAPFVSLLAEYALPIVGLLFFFGGTGAGMISGLETREVFRTLLQGVVGIAPGILLILMAVSVKHIALQGKVMDTILHSAAGAFSQAGPFLSAALIYVLALLLEFFVASGSAKAFLLMPILLPLADLVGVTRQVAVTAYSFGDGFSNTIYPTNPVLLIVLGLSAVSYPKWLRWTLPLWGVIFVLTLAFLGLMVAIGYGPF